MLYAAITLLLAHSIVTSSVQLPTFLPPKSPTVFVHPGVFVSAQQLSFVRTQVQAGTQPFANAYAKALKSFFANLKWEPLGPPASGVIECGFYSNPDIGCTHESFDATAAYLQAALFYVNGTRAYADNALRLINTYAAGLREYNNSNAPLQAAWSTLKWARVADLLRAEPELAIKNVTRMFYNVAMPKIGDCWRAGGNWDISMIEGVLGIAVFSENATLFESALARWRARIPVAFYYEPSDGPSPRPPVCGTDSRFNGQTIFNASTSGINGETCRDLGHSFYELSSAFNGAETALIQGVDLYEEEGQRLAKAAEFMANLWPPFGAWSTPETTPSFMCNGTGVHRGDAKAPTSYALDTLEVARTALAVRKGFSLPLTLDYVETYTRMDNHTSMWFMSVFETLTHGGALLP